jgi:hypothetical protein
MTFRFSGLGIIARRITLTSMTCIFELIRMPMNVNERMRMRPKTRHTQAGEGSEPIPALVGRDFVRDNGQVGGGHGERIDQRDPPPALGCVV